MAHWLEGLSLTHGALHGVLVVGALAALGGLLSLGRGRRWWGHAVPAAVAISALLAVGVLVLVDVTKPWPDGLPTEVVAWIGAGLLGVVLLGAGWRHRRWWVRIAGAAAAVLAVLGAADAVDTVYGAYPTVSTALQLPPYDAVPALRAVPAGRVTGPDAGRPLWESWRPPHAMPSHGAVAEVHIPPIRSGFAARDAWVYLPPAYLTAHRPQLPLLMMIGGQPGSPRDWLDGGQLAQQMDRWAAAHAGLAPVVVMPDALGGLTSNPLCMNSALGRADTYLARDVPAWATTVLRVDPNTAHWAVGGLSYGGTCSLQLAVAHPALFPTFFDASGQRGPTLGGRARTVAAAFGGKEAAFAAVDPLRELTIHRYPRSAAWLVVGAQDAVYRPQALAVAAAARAAGMSVIYRELPGRHSWAVWRPALGDALPWLAQRMGLAP